tara:strand:+ start:751 stop:2325 length:1575 start_codon:yes stop_codon:yes gene_type:complete
MANGRIIEAAKAAYTPAKIDISGFVNGLSSIASGIIQKKKKNDAIRRSADAINFNTNDPRLLAEIKKQKDNILSGGDPTQSVNNLQQIANTINTTIPKINKAITDLNIKGLSGSTDPIITNYFEAIQSGELNTPIRVRDKEGNMQTITTLFNVTDGQLMMLSPDGTYQSPDVVLRTLQNITTQDAGKLTADLLAKYINVTYKDMNTWQDQTNAMKTKLFNDFKTSEKAKLSTLFDYSFHVNDGESTSFKEYYIKNKLYDENSYNEYLEAIENLPEETAEETKNYLMQELIKSDTTLQEDINKFVDSIAESKKPGGDTGGLGYDPLTNVGAQVEEIDKMFSSINTANPSPTLKGNSIVAADEDAIETARSQGFQGDNNNLRMITGLSGAPIIFDATNPVAVKQAMRSFFPQYVKDQNITDDYNRYMVQVDKNINNYILKPNNKEFRVEDETQQQSIQTQDKGNKLVKNNETVSVRLGGIKFTKVKVIDGELFMRNPKMIKTDDDPEFVPADQNVTERFYKKYRIN